MCQKETALTVVHSVVNDVSRHLQIFNRKDAHSRGETIVKGVVSDIGVEVSGVVTQDVHKGQ